MRRKFPSLRTGLTHTATIGGTKFHITVNCFDSGKPGEIFIKTYGGNRHGLQGWCDKVAELTSMLLQSDDYNLETVCRHLKGDCFAPEGFTGEVDIGYVKSLPDFLGKWLWQRFGNNKQKGGAE
jgi:hypothetical protein